MSGEPASDRRDVALKISRFALKIGHVAEQIGQHLLEAEHSPEHGHEHEHQRILAQQVAILASLVDTLAQLIAADA